MIPLNLPLSSPAPAILIENLSLNYQQQILFENLSCVLPAGQFSCIIGTSGVGKTSLLRLIAQLDHPKLLSGKIIADDEQALASRIAYMAQTDLLLPWLSVLDNALIGYRLRGELTHGRRSLAKMLLADVGLIDDMEKYPQALSAGMRQRVALVRTLLEDKPIVLMDEPFSALDAITRLRLQDLAAEFLRDRTVLLVTHDPLEALRLGQTIYQLVGHPAQLQTLFSFSDVTPRDPSDPELLSLQAMLLQKLRADAERVT